MHDENKMGTMPEGKLLISMSMPLVISMLIQALYNVVDSIFVARHSQKALTAISLCFPVQTLMLALATGTGVGINSILSRRLGEKDTDAANRTAANGLLLGVLSWGIAALIGGLFSEAFFSFFTKNAETVRMGEQYLKIVTTCSLGLFLQVVAERLLLSTGKTVLNMITQATGAVMNLILDPLLIFGLGGFPELGVAGAAIATVIAQGGAALVALILNRTKNKDLMLRLRDFRPDFTIIGQIYRIGVPTMIMQSIISIMTVGMNKILANDTAISVFGIYYKLHSFVFMPVFGVTNALVPIVAFNFGARNFGRIKKTIRLAMYIAVGIMAVGTAVFWICPKLLLQAFHANSEMLKIGIPALRIISTSFVFSGVSIILSSTFQALGRAFFSMSVSITRQLLILLPSAFILSRILGLPYVWYSMILSEVGGAVLCIVLFLRVRRTILTPEKQ